MSMRTDRSNAQTNTEQSVTELGTCEYKLCLPFDFWYNYFFYEMIWNATEYMTILGITFVVQSKIDVKDIRRILVIYGICLL